MVFLLWTILAVAAGTLATYLYDDEAGLGTRLAQGIALGFTTLALLGYVITAFEGYTGLSRTLLFLVLGIADLALLRRFGAVLRRDLGQLKTSWRSWLWLVPVGPFLGLLFERVLVMDNGTLATGFDCNLGDVTFHLGIVSGFAFGENFPPENPEYAGTRLTYPFLVDFLVALALRNGLDLLSAFWWENLLLALSLIVLFHRFTLTVTGSRLAAALAPLLLLCSGGLGGLTFFQELRTPLWDYLKHLPHDYTINLDGYRWGNAVTVMLVPQRALLLGLPLALIIWRLWWLALQSPDEAAAKRPMLAAGFIAGILPLAHAHSYLTTMMVAAGLAFIFWGRRWLWFFGPALIVAGPQMFWATRNAAAKAGSFFGWHLGWDRGEVNVFLFWWRNAGLFIPLWLVSLGWLLRQRNYRLLLFHVPFAGLFVISNLFKLSPWIWDNIKFLFIWFLGSVPLVAWFLSRLRKPLLLPVLALLVFGLTFSGGLDIWRVFVHTNLHGEFDPLAQQFAFEVLRRTPPRSRIVTAPTYNNPVELTGRRLIMGYGGHLWSHGMDYGPREAAVREIYAGGPTAQQRMQELEVDYVVIGPQERGSFPTLSEPFFQSYPIVVSVRDYRLYKVR